MGSKKMAAFLFLPLIVGMTVMPLPSLGDDLPLPCRDYGENLVRLARINMPFYFGRCMAVSGEFLYCAGDNVPEIQIVDLSDPAMPVLVGALPVGGTVVGLATRPDVMVVAVEGVGLILLDMENPLAPAPVDTLVLAGDPQDVALVGDMVYATMGGPGVQVATLMVEDRIIPMGSLRIPGGAARNFDVAGDKLYVATSGVGLTVVDVSDPASPAWFSDVRFSEDPLDVSVGYDRALTVGRESNSSYLLRLFDIAVPSSPAQVAATSSTQSGNTRFGLEILAPDRMLVGATTYGAREYEIVSSEFQVRGRGDRFVDIEWGSDLVMAVGYSEVWTATPGPLEPTSFSFADFGTNSPHMVLDDGVIFTGGVTSSDVRAIDVSDPLSPVVSDVIELPEDWLSHNPMPAVVGDVLFWSGHSYGLFRFAIEDPLKPVPMTEIGLPEPVWGVLADGHILYVPTGGNGFTVLDVGDPAAPVELAQLPQTHTADFRNVRMLKVGAEVLVTAESGGIDIFDVSVPSSPALAGHIPVVGDIEDLDWTGDQLVVCLEFEPMEFWAESGGSWSRVGTGITARSAAVHGEVLYASHADGIIMNMTGAGLPEPIYEDYRTGQANGMLATGDRWWVLGGGLKLYPAQCQTALSAVPTIQPRISLMDPARPNPFNPQTSIRFELPVSGQVELVVYDLKGRLIRRLREGFMTAGNHQVTWDGRDVSSRAVAAGVYFLRLEYGDVHEVQKLALVK